VLKTIIVNQTLRKNMTQSQFAMGAASILSNPFGAAQNNNNNQA